MTLSSFENTADTVFLFEFSEDYSLYIPYPVSFIVTCVFENYQRKHKNILKG